MKTIKILLSVILIFCAISLAACGAAPTAQEPEVTPEPTPEPTPQPVEYYITNESADEIRALNEIDSLRFIDGTASKEYDAMLYLYNTMENCEIIWNFELQGEVYPNTTEEIKAVELDGLEDALRYLPALTYVDVIDSPATIEDMDRFYDIRPDVFYYWSFILDGFHMRTDLECYSSLRGLDYYRLTDEDVYPMVKYCKHMKALDLGHDDIRDLTWIGQLTELEVLIIADNPNLVDASPLGNLKNLVYLEFFMNHKCESFEWLNELTNIVDLNLCYCDNLGDLSFLENMPNIRFGMFKYSFIDAEEVQYWSHVYPDAYLTIHDGSIHSCEGGWRETQRNMYIRRNFASWRHITDYVTYSEVYFDYNTYIYP